MVDQCTHRYLTSHGRGWECADCGVGILSLSVPVPLPLIAAALKALGGTGCVTHAEKPKDKPLESTA